MKIRKVAVFGGFAAGAALALAPPAAADELSSTIASEFDAMNAIFTLEADLAGKGGDVMGPTGVFPFEIIPPADAPASPPFTFLDYELWGVNPALADPTVAATPASFDVFNDSLSEFDNASNIELWALLNNGALIPSVDLFGRADVVTAALGTGTVTGEFTTFFGAGLTDLATYFGI